MRYVLGAFGAVAGFVMTLIAGMVIFGILLWFATGGADLSPAIRSLVGAFVLGAGFFGAKLGWLYATAARTRQGAASSKPAQDG